LPGPGIPLKAVIAAICGNIVDLKTNRRRAVEDKPENLAMQALEEEL
jgi:hypothetical protein